MIAMLPCIFLEHIQIGMILRYSMEWQLRADSGSKNTALIFISFVLAVNFYILWESAGASKKSKIK